MATIIQVLLPVLLIMALGYILRRTRVFSDQGIGELKFLVTKIILPVAIFHALSTAEYSRQVWQQVAIMFVMMAVSFGIGYLLRPLMREPFRKYVPFMVSVYEGGMMAYPLYTHLCGMENLSHIALLDIAGLLFGFSVYMSLLTFTESGEKPSAGKLIRDAFKSPPFIAALLGILMGISGGMRIFLTTAAGAVYQSAEQMITAPLSVIILLIVGYSIQLEKDMIAPCLKTVALRAALQAVMVVGTLWAMHRFIGQDRLTDLAVIIYMSAPATFSMQSFVKDQRGGHYVSTANAIYCFVSIAVFAVASVMMR